MMNKEQKIHRSSFIILHCRLVVLLLTACALALFHFAVFTIFDFAATLGVLVANRVADLAIQLFERRGIIEGKFDESKNAISICFPSTCTVILTRPPVKHNPFWQPFWHRL